MGAESTSSRRILIVDDDRGLRHALSALLAAAGHHSSPPVTDLRRWRCLHDRPFDIVLLDIGLPSMSGLDVLARVVSSPTPPRVIMMTADDTPQSLLEAVKRQAYRYIRKPFPPNTIVDVVNEAVAPAAALSIEVVSARPEWLELVAPCTLEMADRIQSFVMQLEARSAGGRARSGRAGVSRAADERGRVGRQARSEPEGPHLMRQDEEDAALPDRRSWRGIRYRRPAACGDLESRKTTRFASLRPRGAEASGRAASVWR